MHSSRSKTHNLVIFRQFRCSTTPFGFAPHTLRLKLVFRVVSRHFVAAPDPLWKSVSGAFNAWVYTSESISCFSQRTCTIHYFGSKKLMFWVVPSHFVAALDMLQKPYRGAFNARVYASRTVSWFFCSKHAQSTTLGQKLIFWMVSRILLPHLSYCGN